MIGRMILMGILAGAVVLTLAWIVCVITHRTGVTLWRLSDD